MEYLFRQRPRLGDKAVFPPLVVSKSPGKYLCVLVSRTSENNVVGADIVNM